MTLTMRKVAVECRNIRLAYDRTEVLRDVSLKIEPGEFFALLGPSGSGKSTLLRLIAGFNRHQHGQLLVDGKDIGNTPPYARNIGMVFQSYALWPHLSVHDNVAFGLVERKVAKAEIARRVAEALKTVGLNAYGQRRPNQLSGGQQQRVALARTIVIEPQVLLLDEPLSNLDKNLRVQMRQELLALQRRLGITTLFVTHDQEEAMTTADRMAVLDKGVVQQVGTPAELYDFPVNHFVAGFVGTMNLLVGSVQARGQGAVTLRADGVGDLDLPDDGHWPTGSRVAASFRPHTVRLRAAQGAEAHRAGIAGTIGLPGATGRAVSGPDSIHGADPGPGSACLWLRGTVESTEFSGEFTRYHVAVGGQSVTADQVHQVGSELFAVGSAVWLGIEPDNVRLLAA